MSCINVMNPARGPEYITPDKNVVTERRNYNHVDGLFPVAMETKGRTDRDKKSVSPGLKRVLDGERSSVYEGNSISQYDPDKSALSGRLSQS